ncbi:hypothetical protein JQC92_02930 [Shewanella sp. 202IG2-18]|uniref:hypothetical protein n=1 Tax=Parashewanella hymeniacidonis TaxID=2807618 RepID=UPI0019603ECE|nr:hypothetical protein [Parashewanella hymeniacidonis]MBM7070995.1 hypothetical protein [Parashewanella hymeniacidonis]
MLRTTSNKKALFSLMIALFSLPALADDSTVKINCVKAQDFKGLKGSGTSDQPYIIPVNSCLRLDGNNGKTYQFSLPFTKESFKGGDRLHIEATSFKSQGCKDGLTSCGDTQITPNLKVTPKLDLFQTELASGFFSGITSLEPGFTTYKIQASTKAETLNVTIATKGQPVENNYANPALSDN